MDHTAQRPLNVTRSRFDRLLDILKACEEIDGVSRLVDDVSNANVGDVAIQGAARAMGRVARQANDIVSTLIAEEDHRLHQRRLKRRLKANKAAP